jgi:hypothetical protein
VNALKQMLDRQKQLKAGDSTVPPPPPPPAPAEDKPKPAGLNFIKAKAAGTTPALRPIPATAEPVVADVVLSLDDIAESEDQGVSRAPTHVSQHAFADEIPATAPIRDLPEDLDKQQREFVAQLDSVYEIVHDPELFSQFIRTIMEELKSNPDYVRLMADQDVHTMIRGLRESMGLARIKKVEKSTKTRASKKSVAGNEMLATADAIFNSEDW